MKIYLSSPATPSNSDRQGCLRRSLGKQLPGSLCFFLFALAPPVALDGAVVPGARESSATLVVDVVRDGTEVFSGSDSDFTQTNGTSIASIGGPEVVDDGGQPLLDFEGYVTGRQFVVRDEGDFMRFIASANIDLAYELAAAGPSDTVDYLGAAGASFEFEITGAAMDVSLGWNIGSVGGPGFEPEVSLVREGDPIPLYQFPAPPGEEDPGNGFGASLAPGTYSVAILMPINATDDQSIKQDLAFSMTVGEEPDEVPLPPQGDYTHPDVVTQRDGAGILQVVTPQIVAETSLGDGTTELRVTGSVENLRAAPWPEVEFGVATSLEGEPEIEIISLPAPLALGAEETAPVAGEWVLRVADADLPTVRASLLDGSRFRLSGAQQPVFAYPVRPLGPRGFENPPSSSLGITSSLIFPYAPTIGSGTVWLEWEPFYKEPTFVQIGLDPLSIARVQGPDGNLPIMIKDILRSGTNFAIIPFDPDNPSAPGGGRLPLPKVMKEGQAVDVLTFDGHPEGLGVTEDPETRTTSNGLSLAGLFPAPVPFHFNRFELSPGVEVSGSFGFRPDELVINLEMKDFGIEALEVTARYRADCNLLLETSEGADNSAEPIAGSTGTLLDLPLLEINLSNGFSFAPRLVLEAGALISAPTSLSVPLTAGLDVTILAGFRDGAPVYDSDFTSIPLQVSDPGLYEALGASAEAFIDCEIKALFGVAGNFAQSGPTLGARAAAEFDVTPLAVTEPWWSVDAEFSTFAGVEFNLAGILTLIDAEQTLRTWPLSPFFPLSADGPLLPPLAAQSIDPQPGFEPLGDARTRWSRTLLPDSDGLIQGKSDATVLADGDILAVGGDTIARLSPQGELRWVQDTSVQLLAGAVVAEPDGGFTALSIQRNVIRLARFDAAGGVIWSRAVTGANGVLWFETRGLARRESAGGASEYFVLGQAIGSSAGGFHPSIVKLDADGNVLWGKIYPVPPLESEGISSDAGGLAVTAAGDVVVAGDTTADVEAAGSLGNISRNGLIFKVDGDTGETIWSTLVAESDIAGYSAASEGPDGSIYVGGNSLQGVTSENPSMLVVKLEADGSLVDSVLIGSAESSDPVPHGGESVYDEIRDMVWVDGQLWVCGQIGLFNSGSVDGTAEGASAFTAMLSEKLDVSRFVIHAGPATDAFETIEATANGLLVSGFSGSFHPWLSTGNEGEGNPGSLWVAMLPWEGRMHFHQASAARRLPDFTPAPDAGSHFVTPRVRATSQFAGDTNQRLFAGLSQDNLTASGSDTRLIGAEDYTPTESTFSLAPTFFDPEEYKSLEFIPESLITDMDTYLQWWQIEPGDDGDGDGLEPEAEFFLGTSVRESDFGVFDFEYLTDETSGDPFVRFTLTRSHLAAPALPAVRSNDDLLSDSGPRTDVDARTEPLDASRDRLILELPAPEPKQFFWLEFPR